MIVLLITLAVFLTLAILLSRGKAAFLIAGYNTLPPEEQAKYDIDALSKFMGKIMFGASGGLLLLVFGGLLPSTGLQIAGTVLLLLVSIFAVVRTNTGNRFKKETPTP